MAIKYDDHGTIEYLNNKIEDLRTDLHRLVSSDQARLLAGDVYELSVRLDRLIMASQQAGC